MKLDSPSDDDASARSGKIAARLSKYVSANVVFNAVSWLNGVLLARILGPAMFGEWQLFKLILQYSTYSSFSVQWPLARRMRSATSEEDRKTLDVVRNAASTINLISTLVAAVIVFVVLLVKGWPSGVPAALIIAICVFAQLKYSFRLFSITSQKKLRVAVYLSAISSIGGFICTVVLAWAYGFYGALFGQAAVFIALLYSATRYEEFRYRLVVDISVMKSLLREGIGFTANGLLASLVVAQERIILLYIYGTELLGLYGLSIIIIASFESITAYFFSGYFPYMSEYAAIENGGSKSREAVMPAYERFYNAYVSLVIISAAFMPLFVSLALPKYQPSLFAAFIALSSMLFMPHRSLAVYFTAANNEIYKTLRVYIPTLLVITAPAIMLVMEYGLTGAAVSQLMAQIVLAIFLSRSAFGLTLSEAVRMCVPPGLVGLLIIGWGWIYGFLDYTIALLGGVALMALAYYTLDKDNKRMIVGIIKRT